MSGYPTTHPVERGLSLCRQVERLRFLANPLSRIQDFVRTSQHLLWALAHFVLLPSGREGNRNLLALPVYFQRVETAEYKLQLLRGALRKQNEELIAAQAHRQVATTNHVIQPGGKFLQY